MMVARDPAIKLFGKEIPVPKNGRTLAFSGENSAGDFGHVDHDRTLMMATCLEDKKVSGRGDGEQEEEEENETEADHKYPLADKPTGSKQEDEFKSPTTEEPENQETLPESDQDPKTPSSGDKETGTENPPKNENDQSDTNNPQQTPLKKPDKILPCPRCNSMDTKFCYYNNYNVNQPRHFCKSCQRYWTAGGTMRNVPVGAGRRKNKNSTLHCRHITISEALQAARIDAPNGIHHPAFKTNGTVLSFGPEAPIFESVAAVLNPAEKKAPNGILNGLYKVEQGVPVSCNGGEKGDDCSSGSSVTTLNSTDEGVRNGLQERFASQIPCLPGVPWPYPWNSAIPVPAFCPSGIPVPFYPAPYWNCSVPGAWSVPWLSPPSLNTNQTPPNSAPNLTTLGKHSRDGDLLIPSNPDEKRPLEHKNSERSILIPKTLRIDDPDEAARSSIWTTLGIKNDSISRRGLFKAFQAKGEEKNHIAETHSPLQTNPAALSRSLSFQETA